MGTNRGKLIARNSQLVFMLLLIPDWSNKLEIVAGCNSFTVQIRAVLGQSLEVLNLLALRSVDYKRINSHNIKQREYLSVRLFLIEDRIWHSFELLM